MRTLFSENINAPPTASELSSYSTSESNNSEQFVAESGNFSSTNTSNTAETSRRSSRQDIWLTKSLQSQAESEGQTSFTYGEPEVPPSSRKGNPRLLFMGMRRAGKSSVQKVVFQKFSPPETLYLDPTEKIETAEMQSFMHFESAEIPFHIPVLSPDYDHASIFSNIGAVIWLIDSQDDYLPCVNELLRVAIFLTEHYPRINLEVFIHKTDGLSEEYKNEAFREIRQRVQDELSDVGYGHRSISYYQTSIFDHSIFEAMSKVVQKLLPQLPAMEALLTRLAHTCRIQKAYLFDTISKIYIATDASPTLLKDYEVCSDYVDIVVDFKQLYGWHGKVGADGRPAKGERDSVKTPFVGESLVTYDRSGDTYIYAREIIDSLSLVCIMGKGSSVDKRTLVDYNMELFQEAMEQIFKA